MAETIKMTREIQPGEKGPCTADVHPDEVEAMVAAGWRVNAAAVDASPAEDSHELPRRGPGRPRKTQEE